MVVALNPNSNRQTIANINDPSIFSRTYENLIPFSGQTSEVNPRRLIRAVFAPHHRIESEFKVVWRTPKQGNYLLVFTIGETKNSVPFVCSRFNCEPLFTHWLGRRV